MHYLDLTLSELTHNLALDEVLLLEAEAGRGGEWMRVWEWPNPAVVLGAGCAKDRDVHVDRCLEDAVPIARRSSGGGTVLLGHGCLMFSFILCYDRARELRTVRGSYRYILERLRDAFASLSPSIKHEGISDLTIGDRKFSGNAQQRKHRFLLHHGTLLYRFDTALVIKYLCLPERQPTYRQKRAHEDFLTNLPCTSTQAKHLLQTTWAASPCANEPPVPLAIKLSAEKYNIAHWTNRW